MLIKTIMMLGLLFSMSGCGGGSESEKEISTPLDDASVVEQEENTLLPQTQDLTSTQQEVIRLHNEKRHNYFTDSDLTYSSELEESAQKYANLLGVRGAFEHDPNNGRYGYGENLYAHSANTPLTTVDAMPHWYDEEQPLYNYETGDCQEAYYDNGSLIKCGHYTQVIWQDTTEVGCATAKYQAGALKGGYVYVCKYKKSGNNSINGVALKPYCNEYSKEDIYLGNAPSFTDIALKGRVFPVELVVEDRVNCERTDNYNSAIEFGSDLRTVKVENFQIFNDGKYPNTLEFDSISIEGKTVMLRGINQHINDTKYQDRNIFMSLKLLGETTTYYSVEMEWNGLDESLPQYARHMKAKLYK